MEQKQEKKNIAEVISLRGTGEIYLPDNAFEFVPQKKGEPIQKDVKKYGVAKAYTTTGKDPKRVITLQCPNDTTDPYATLCSQFKSVMKSEYQKDLPSEILPKGVILANRIYARIREMSQLNAIPISVGVRKQKSRRTPNPT